MKELLPGIDLCIEENIATITLNIPDRHNALSDENIQLFREHLATVRQSISARVLIITGAGEKTFCAGAALDQLGSGQLNGDVFTDLTDAIAAVEIPTICSFNGNAYGGGTEIGLACDFRIGFAEMKLFVPPARIGLCYPVRGIERMVKVMGINTTKRFLISSEDFDGEELFRLGYLTHTTLHNNVQNTGHQLAQRIAAYAPIAVSAMKAISNMASTGMDDYDKAYEIAARCNQSNDLQEGLTAMKEKRSPQFSGN